jgi:hypothetical protein
MTTHRCMLQNEGAEAFIKGFVSLGRLISVCMCICMYVCIRGRMHAQTYELNSG